MITDQDWSVRQRTFPGRVAKSLHTSPSSHLHKAGLSASADDHQCKPLTKILPYNCGWIISVIVLMQKLHAQQLEFTPAGIQHCKLRTMARFGRQAILSDCVLYKISLQGPRRWSQDYWIHDNFCLRTSLWFLTTERAQKRTETKPWTLLDRPDWSRTAIHMQGTVQRKARHGIHWRACIENLTRQMQGLFSISLGNSPSSGCWQLASFDYLLRWCIVFCIEHEPSLHLWWELSLFCLLVWWSQ